MTTVSVASFSGGRASPTASNCWNTWPAATLAKCPGTNVEAAYLKACAVSHQSPEDTLMCLLSLEMLVSVCVHAIAAWRWF